jgi:hypothetical protein
MGRVNNPFLVPQCAGDFAEVAHGHGVNQIVGCSRSVDLNKIGARGVAETACSLSVEGQRSFRIEKVVQCAVESSAVLNQN